MADNSIKRPIAGVEITVQKIPYQESLNLEGQELFSTTASDHDAIIVQVGGYRLLVTASEWCDVTLLDEETKEKANGS